VSELYQTYRYPETLLIGRDGVVVERYVGPREWDSPLYEARLRSAARGRVVSEAAQRLVALVDSLDTIDLRAAVPARVRRLAYVAYVSFTG
jgi:hypothetical protein